MKEESGCKDLGAIEVPAEMCWWEVKGTLRTWKSWENAPQLAEASGRPSASLGWTGSLAGLCSREAAGWRKRGTST